MEVSRDNVETLKFVVNMDTYFVTGSAVQKLLRAASGNRVDGMLQILVNEDIPVEDAHWIVENCFGD
jgi:hypothetical protein